MLNELFNKKNDGYTGLKYRNGNKIYIGDKARGWFIGSFPSGQHSNDGIIKVKNDVICLYSVHGYIELDEYTEGITKL